LGWVRPCTSRIKLTMIAMDSHEARRQSRQNPIGENQGQVLQD
jgi:hypothetical protein